MFWFPPLGLGEGGEPAHTEPDDGKKITRSRCLNNKCFDCPPSGLGEGGEPAHTETKSKHLLTIYQQNYQNIYNQFINTEKLLTYIIIITFILRHLSSIYYHLKTCIQSRKILCVIVWTVTVFLWFMNQTELTTNAKTYWGKTAIIYTRILIYLRRF